MIIYCEKCQQRFDTDRFEECPRCADHPKPDPLGDGVPVSKDQTTHGLELPEMPRQSGFFYPASLHLDTVAYEEALESWGRECANLAQREAALADGLAEALEKCERASRRGDYKDIQAACIAVLAKVKEARR